MQPSAPDQHSSPDQHRRAVVFRDLHAGGVPFVIPNPWDAGTARLLTQAGFAALATTSAGLSFGLGRPDGANLVSREEALTHAKAMVEATHLPVSADLENGFGDAPEQVAETVRQAAAVGLVGCSVEDATGRPDDPIHPFGVAVERVAAAVEAARSLPFPFTLTARAENFLHGRPDLDDTLRRLRAYEEAGADVLFAPGLPDLAAIRTVCSSVGRPVNALAGPTVSVAELADCGVRRISLGSALPRLALASLLVAAEEIRTAGTFGFARSAIPHATVNEWMARPIASA